MRCKSFPVLMAIIITLMCATAAAAQKLTVSVMDLNVTEGLSAKEVVMLTDKLLNEFVNTGSYKVVERSKRDEILKEVGFQQSGACDQSSCLVQAGQQLGVQKMVGGTIGKMGSVFAVELRMMDVKTGEIDMAFSREYTGDVSALLKAMKEAAAEFSKWKPAPKAQAIAPLNVDYGGLVIRSTPLGARIFLDGADVGTTPGQLSKIEAGDHQVIITKEGYSSFSQTVKVGKNVTATVNAVLTREYGTLTITSEPANTTVYIDGVPKGTVTGSGLKVAGLGIGVHKIKVSKTGYQAYRGGDDGGERGGQRAKRRTYPQVGLDCDNQHALWGQRYGGRPAAGANAVQCDQSFSRNLQC